MGASHSEWSTFLKYPIWNSRYTSLQKKALCSRGIRYGLSWWYFIPFCSSITTGFILQVPRVPSNINWYLFSISRNIPCLVIFKCSLFDTILLKSSFWYFASKILRVHHMESSTCSLSHNYLFMKLASSQKPEGYFIGAVHPLYAPISDHLAHDALPIYWCRLLSHS